MSEPYVLGIVGHICPRNFNTSRPRGLRTHRPVSFPAVLDSPKVRSAKRLTGVLLKYGT
jgi:hypothetical protein